MGVGDGVIHYHGTPITPRTVLTQLAGRNFCVPFPNPQDVEVCHEIGQSVMLDNGAFSLWMEARRKGDVTLSRGWGDYYEWAERWLEFPTTWAVIPDVIDGDEAMNDELLLEWPHGDRGAPVWHMHESLDRLLWLCQQWQRVCVGSSGLYAQVGAPSWHRRMHEAMDALCGNGPVPVWLHMLRGLDLAGGEYPFASADSTNIARNHAGSHRRQRQDARRMADRIDGVQCPGRWSVKAQQLGLVDVVR